MPSELALAIKAGTDSANARLDRIEADFAVTTAIYNVLDAARRERNKYGENEGENNEKRRAILAVLGIE
jgi:hypothetical protein